MIINYLRNYQAFAAAVETFDTNSETVGSTTSENYETSSEGTHEFLAHCVFALTEWIVIGEIYNCDLKNFPGLEDGASAFTGVVQNHEGDYTDDSVKALFVKGLNTDMFPSGLGKFFQNIEGIYACYDMRLMEIHQSDLKPFPKLKFLALCDNNILTIENDLFSFNTDLEYINLNANPLIHIDANAFDSLTKLNSFHVTTDFCEFENSSAENIDEVKQLVAEINAGKCTNEKHSEIFEFRKKITDNSNILKYFGEMQNCINPIINQIE